MVRTNAEKREEILREIRQAQREAREEMESPLPHSCDLNHEKKRMESALRAIVARINGVYDDPDLMSFGPLGLIMSDDIIAIAKGALPKKDLTDDLADIMGVKLGKRGK